MSAVQQFMELFRGKDSAYAIKTVSEGRKFYAPARKDGADLPLTEEVCEKHLLGEISIGSYAFLDPEGHIRWAVVDFDGKRGDSVQDAHRVVSELRKVGLSCFMERSQSGRGIHVWLFFDAPIKAAYVRRILASCIPEFTKPTETRETSFDMVIPDTDIPSGDYGKLCGLPLNGPELVNEGRTAFVDVHGNKLEHQSAMLEEMMKHRNSVTAVQVIAGKFPSITKLKKAKAVKEGTDDLPAGGIKLFSPYGCSWLHRVFDLTEKGGEGVTEPEWFAAIGQFAQVRNGAELAHRFSAGDSRYDYDTTQRKFDTAAEKNMPMKVETVCEKFPGHCGNECVCKKLGLRYPWEIAKQSITKLAKAHSRGRIYTAREVSVAAFAAAKEIDEGKRMGFPWGYDHLDDNTELRPKDLVVVAARRSVGKTAVMIDTNVKLGGRMIPQYVLSMEMSSEQLGLRYLANISEIDHTLITTGGMSKEQWFQLAEARDRLAGMPIFVEEYTTDPNKLLDIVGELVFKHGKGVVWLDYLQLSDKAPGEKQKEAVDRALKSYLVMAKTLDVPVVSLAQLNRSEETSESETELDSWLKDSGNIEQDTDAVHYLRGRLGPGVLLRKWRIHKERHRASGIDFRFEFRPWIYKFTPLGLWNDSNGYPSSYELGEEEDGDEQLGL